MSYHLNHLITRQMSDSLLLAHHSPDKAKDHLWKARLDLLCLLSQDVGAYAGARDTLVDLIEKAIDDVHDTDVTFNNYAESIVAALLQNVVPMPEEDRQPTSAK